ncbi:MAG: hypothetical protein SFX73_26890 [Kofleriaceae bacterium]|nr:hypothetical protein [Kofleriaceae bacterium]
MTQLLPVSALVALVSLGAGTGCSDHRQSKARRAPTSQPARAAPASQPAARKHLVHEHAHGAHPHARDPHHHHPHPHPHLDGGDHHHPY